MSDHTTGGRSEHDRIEQQGERLAQLASKWKPELREVLERLYARDHGDDHPMPEDALLATWAKYNRQYAAHPDTIAKRSIERHLEAAHLEPVLRASPELSRFVSLMRELLYEACPGHTLDHILAPLFSLVGASSAALAARGTRRARSQVEADNLDAVLIAWLHLDSATRDRKERPGPRDLVGMVAGLFASAEPDLMMDRGTIRKHLRTLVSLGTIES